MNPSIPEQLDNKIDIDPVDVDKKKGMRMGKRNKINKIKMNKSL